MLVAPFALGFAAHPPAARRAAARSRSRATVTLGPFAAVDRWYREHSLRTRWQRDWPERIILIRHGESLGNTDKVHALSVPSRSDIHPEDSSPHTCRIKGFLRHVPAGALQQDSRLADRADRPRLRPGCARWHEAAQARRQRALLTRTPQGLRAVRTAGLRAPACCVPCVPQAQGSLPRGSTYCTRRRTRTRLRRAVHTACRVYVEPCPCGAPGNETVRFFHSPYMRTRQTLAAILKANFIGQAVQVSSEPRLREQVRGGWLGLGLGLVFFSPLARRPDPNPNLTRAATLALALTPTPTRAGLWKLPGHSKHGFRLCRPRALRSLPLPPTLPLTLALQPHMTQPLSPHLSPIQVASSTASRMARRAQVQLTRTRTRTRTRTKP